MVAKIWSDAVSHLHHKIKVVNIWLVFKGLQALKKLKFLFLINQLSFLTGQPFLVKGKAAKINFFGIREKQKSCSGFLRQFLWTGHPAGYFRPKSRN